MNKPIFTKQNIKNWAFILGLTVVVLIVIILSISHIAQNKKAKSHSVTGEKHDIFNNCLDEKDDIKYLATPEEYIALVNAINSSYDNATNIEDGIATFNVDYFYYGHNYIAFKQDIEDYDIWAVFPKDEENEKAKYNMAVDVEEMILEPELWDYVMEENCTYKIPEISLTNNGGLFMKLSDNPSTTVLFIVTKDVSRVIDDIYIYGGYIPNNVLVEHQKVKMIFEYINY